MGIEKEKLEKNIKKTDIKKKKVTIKTWTGLYTRYDMDYCSSKIFKEKRNVDDATKVDQLLY